MRLESYCSRIALEFAKQKVLFCLALHVILNLKIISQIKALKYKNVRKARHLSNVLAELQRVGKERNLSTTESHFRTFLYALSLLCTLLAFRFHSRATFALEKERAKKDSNRLLLERDKQVKPLEEAIVFLAQLGSNSSGRRTIYDKAPLNMHWGAISSVL